MRGVRRAVVIVAWVIATMADTHAHNVVEVEVSPSGDSNPRQMLGQEQTPHVPTSTQSPIVGNRDQSVYSSQSAQYDHQASRVALEKEIEAIDLMIHLQELKMRALSKLRMDFENQDIEATNGELGLGYRARASSDGRDQELRDAIDRRMDAIAAQMTHRVSSERFDSHFIEKLMLPLPDDVVAVGVDKIRTAPTIDLIVVALKSGSVRFFSSTDIQKELLQFDTNVRDVQSIKLDFQADPPVLGILGGGLNPHVAFFSLACYVEESAHGRTQKQVTIKVHEMFKISPSAYGSIPTAIAIARSARRSAFAVAGQTGKLSFFAHNGTLLHEIDARAGPIAVMATQRHHVALGSDSRVFLFSMSRQKHGELTVCEGSIASIVSLVFDANNPGILYAGTSDGEVLVFDHSGTVEGATRGCQVVQRFVIQRSSSVHVAVIKNHVIAASAKEVAVYNLSRVQNHARLSLSKVCYKSSHFESVSSVIATENTYTTTVGVISSTAAGAKSLILLQSLLPSDDLYNSDSTFSAWRALLITMMILGVAITSQYFLRRDPDNDPNGSIDSSANWHKLLEKHGRASAYMRDRPVGREQKPQTGEYLGDPTTYGADVGAFTASQTRGKRSGVSTHVNEAELRKKIEEARRETLECAFDDSEDDGESD